MLLRLFAVTSLFNIFYRHSLPYAHRVQQSILEIDDRVA